MPNTKIVATLGPASDGEERIAQLVEAGADVFRLNASHGDQETHAARIAAVRAVATRMNRHIGILLDLQGPKIRLGKFENKTCDLTAGSIFVITTQPVLGNAERASTGYAQLPRDVKIGDRILLADGAAELRVVDVRGEEVRTEVVVGGRIGDNKGINLPGVDVSAPSLTEKDLDDLRFGVKAGVDLVALSFVRGGYDVYQLRRMLRDLRADIPIVAKIEKPEAWDNIDAILAEANGLMVARGDLGVEMALEKVPRIQKSMIRRARRRGRFVITATQMLESMIENPTPTRAEVSDVANAIYDGTDAIMLSAETSVGKYPVHAVEMMDRIARETEQAMRARGFADPPHGENPTYAEIVADAAYHAARDAGTSAIVVFTSGGYSARLVARYRPPVPIYAFTPSDAVSRQLSVVYGAFPIIAPTVNSTDEMLAQMDHMLVQRGLVAKGEAVVFVAGQPIGRPGTTNLMKLHRVGDS